jgi:SOS-response transcriptional repressor LexA
MGMNTKLVKNRLMIASDRAGISAMQLAERTGFKKDYFRDFLTGKKKSVSAEALARAGKFLGVDPNWILGGEMFLDPNDPPVAARSSPPVPMLPVYRQVATAKDGRFVFDGQRVAEVRRPPQLERVKSAYALQINGNSLEPRFLSGDTLYVDPSRAPRAHTPVVARIDIGGKVYGIIAEYVSMGDKLMIQSLATGERTGFPAHDVRGIDVIRLVEI